MKKLIAIVAVGLMAAGIHAATVDWSGYDVMDASGTNPYEGTMILHCVELAGITSSAVAEYGEYYGDSIISDDLVAGQTFNFYVTSEDASGNVYTSTTKSALMLNVGSANLNFDSGSWSGSPVPEPTSGLMLLLGVAGLALRRKQK